MPAATVSRVSESDDLGVTPVPDRVLDDLADVLVDRIDQLLDRLTAKAMTEPTPGSRQWESAWNERDTAAGRARADERSRVRNELTRRMVANLGPKHAVAQRVPGRHRQGVRTRTTGAGRSRVDNAQLAFF